MNNFDQSSTGTNIELSASYDTLVSQMNFNDNIQVITNSGYSESCLAFYTDSGQLDSDDCLGVQIKGLKADLLKYCIDNMAYGYTNKDSKADLLDAILTDYEGIKTFYSYQSDLSEYNIELSFINDVQEIEIRGYSQGDYAKVLCDFTSLKKLWGNQPLYSDLDTMLVNLFYDAPVYAKFTIDGIEYDYSDYCDDSYIWDRDKFLNGVSKESKVALETLAALCPVDLKHD
jgi:hypothetical protein